MPPSAVRRRGLGGVRVRVDESDTGSPGPRLARLAERLANYRLADLVIADTIEYDSPWNWKLLVENFMEADHHIGPHRDTFQQNHPAAAAFVADNHGEPFALLEMPGTDSVDEFWLAHIDAAGAR